MADLMFRPYTLIKVTQQPQATDTTPRNNVIEFNFCNQWNAVENWTDLTNRGKITIPKNVFARNARTGAPFDIGNRKEYITNLFRRGDKVEITTGYYKYNANTGNESLETYIAFNGYISKVNSKIPVTLELEDNMWQLKQIPCKPQVWPKNKTVEELMKSLLQGTNFTVNATTETTVGDLIIQNESVAQLLSRLRKDFHLEAYFLGNELRIGSLVYIPPTVMPKEVPTFVFQQNIISDDLSYSRKDDIKLSAICESINTVSTGKFNKAGEEKTKQERLQVLVYVGADGKFKYIKKKKDVDFPANEEGERRKLFYPNITDAAELAKAGANELVKYYYDGFKGKFTTFAIPAIKLGDYIYLRDNILPDRNGYYVVKSVERSGGVGGGRQIIELAYKLVHNGTAKTLNLPTITPELVP